MDYSDVNSTPKQAVRLCGNQMSASLKERLKKSRTICSSPLTTSQKPPSFRSPLLSGGKNSSFNSPILSSNKPSFQSPRLNNGVKSSVQSPLSTPTIKKNFTPTIKKSSTPFRSPPATPMPPLSDKVPSAAAVTHEQSPILSANQTKRFVSNKTPLADEEWMMDTNTAEDNKPCSAEDNKPCSAAKSTVAAKHPEDMLNKSSSPPKKSKLRGSKGAWSTEVTNEIDLDDAFCSSKNKKPKQVCASSKPKLSNRVSIESPSHSSPGFNYNEDVINQKRNHDNDRAQKLGSRRSRSCKMKLSAKVTVSNHGENGTKSKVSKSQTVVKISDPLRNEMLFPNPKLISESVDPQTPMRTLPNTKVEGPSLNTKAVDVSDSEMITSEPKDTNDLGIGNSPGTSNSSIATKESPTAINFKKSVCQSVATPAKYKAPILPGTTPVRTGRNRLKLNKLWRKSTGSISDSSSQSCTPESITENELNVTESPELLSNESSSSIPVTKQHESVAKEQESIAKEQEHIAKEQEHIAKEQEHVAKEQEHIAKEQDESPQHQPECSDLVPNCTTSVNDETPVTEDEAYYSIGSSETKAYTSSHGPAEQSGSNVIEMDSVSDLPTLTPMVFKSPMVKNSYTGGGTFVSPLLGSGRKARLSCPFDRDSGDDPEVGELRKEHRRLSKIVKEKQETLRRLKLVETYRKKNNLEALRAVTVRWKEACASALGELKAELPEPGISLAQLAQAYHVNQEWFDADSSD